jgi:alpha-tubulin suppressor-like RCC1 family protein
LLADGGVACWGNNRGGQLGDGTTTDSALPERVPCVANAVALTTGGYHACAVLSDGSATCWGVYLHGEAGRFLDYGTMAGPVYGLTGVTAITAGAEYTCTLLEDGSVQCFGDNEYDQVGTGTRVPLLVPGF